MKILVTGGTGFTGKALVKRLLDLGHVVVALDNKEGVKTQELRQWGAQVVIGSVTDRDVARRCLQGVEVVQHLAAAFREMTVPNTYYHEVNVGGTRVVMEEAQRAGARKVIYCSTCGVHGNIDHPPGGEDDAPIQPEDYYQQTKYEAEPIALEFNAKGLPTTILRPAAIYGPGDPERFLFIYKFVNKGWFPMFGDGRTLYHPLYIDSLVDALVLAMEPGRGEGQAYLIADEHYVAIEDLVGKVARAMDKPFRFLRLPYAPFMALAHVCEKVCKPLKIAPPLFPRRMNWYRQNRAFKIEKAKRDLGYNPVIDLDEGLRRTAIWYREEGYLR